MSSESKPFAVIDVETTMILGGEYPRTLFWGFANDDGYDRFENTKDFLRFLKSLKPHVLLHHSNFDVLQLLLDGANIQILRSHNARLIRCKLGEQILLNSFSVFPMSLASIFACFGYKKTPLNCKKHSDDYESSYRCPDCKSLLAKRNYDDCVAGLDCFLRLDDIFNELVSVSPLQRGTIAGTSFHAAELCAGDKLPEDQRFLESYRGGRVEVFNTSQATCDKFDINSSYPFSFLDCPVKGTLLKVEVETKDFYCPLFDASCDDTLLFPNGKFVSWVYADVLEKYLEPNWTKTKIKILGRTKIDFSWMVSVRPLITKLFNLKNESKQKEEFAITTACKLLLNSMYGRIGLKGESERARILDYFPDSDESTVFKLGRKKYLVFDTVFRETKSNFPFAAYITDNARGRLYQAFVKSKAYYGDTDSVMTPLGKSSFKNTGDSCGQWKHEGRDLFKANNVKDYMWGEEEVRKGGDGFIQWTLKTLGAGKMPVEIKRERISELRKRRTTFNGETLPLVVNR